MVWSPTCETLDSGCRRHLSWRKRTPSPPRRPWPWLVSWIIIALIGHRSAIDNRCFRRPACSTHYNLPAGSRAQRHRTRTRTGCTCASAESCRTGTAPGRYSPGANGPLCAHYVKQGASGPAGRLAALNASLCLGFRRNSEEFRNSTELKRHNKRGKKASTSCYSTITVEVALPFLPVSLLPPSSFLPPVRTPASQGPTSPPSAPPR